MLRVHGLTKSLIATCGSCAVEYMCKDSEPNKKQCRDAGLVPLLTAIKNSTESGYVGYGASYNANEALEQLN